jgi:hypothetical protein
LKNDSRDQKRIKNQACWATRFFHSYDGINDPRIAWLALVNWLEESHMQLDCNDVNPELPSSVPFSCDQTEQVRLEGQESIDQKNYENKTVPIATFSPEAHEDLSTCQEELDQLLDELNEEDACRSRIPVTDSPCSQPLVRL